MTESSVFVKKITSKSMVGNTQKASYGELYKVIGSAISLKTGTSMYGEWTALVGQFKAWNAAKTVESNLLFLPEVALVPLAINIKAGETVDFGLSIIKVEAENSVGFEYTVKNIIPIKRTNQLDQLQIKFNQLEGAGKKSSKDNEKE